MIINMFKKIEILIISPENKNLLKIDVFEKKIQ